MTKHDNLWYRLGYALETARQRLPAARSSAGTLLKRPRKKPKKADPSALDEAYRKLLEAFVTVGAGTALTRLLAFWPGSRRPGLLGLGRASAAGAAAAFLAELLRPALAGEGSDAPRKDDIADLLLAGAGRGLIYAAIVEPRIPGPSLLQGSAYGVLEWALTPWGGLEGVAGPATPQGRVPILSTLLRGRKEEEELLEHLAFGIALALLYRR
jgi:hypothetical protein